MRDSTEIRIKILSILESKGVIADGDIEDVAADIVFEMMEYTNFLKENYKLSFGEWVNKLTDIIAYNPLVILEDYAESKSS